MARPTASRRFHPGRGAHVRAYILLLNVVLRLGPAHCGGRTIVRPYDRHVVPIFAAMRAGPLSVLLLRLGLVAAVYALIRLLFVWHNAALFPDVPGSAYLGGIRFDLFAIAWINLPWVLLVLAVPRPGRSMARVQTTVFVLLNGLFVVANVGDIGYYGFTLKRSTADLLNIMTSGGDLVGLLPAFLRDFWYLFLLLIGLFVLLAWSYRAIGRLDAGHSIAVPWRIGWRVVALALLVLASRGGIQLIPLQPLDAARYGGPTVLPVVLNTPYTLLMSFGKPALTKRTYLTQEVADRWWPVMHHFTYTRTPSHTEHVSGPPPSPDRPNVVVIILESFSALYSGTLSGGESHMPFLDSLMAHGQNYTQAYANGRRSIDAVPAILASIPHLMEETFTSSPYASLPITSLAKVLGLEGYSTSFYHGGRNGTMGFDGFARAAGFSRYVGMNEYPDAKADFDGHWGIRDRPFLQFWAQELAREQEPFLSTIFTLSSHHPYNLPAEEAERFSGGTQAIHPTLRYTDDALRRFFATARNMPWYDNTLFVITADHTADLERTGIHGDLPIDYWVPLLYLAPWLPADTLPNVTQHIDILPSILLNIGYEKPFFSFGQVPVGNGAMHGAIWYANGLYTITSDRMQLQFDGEQVVGTKLLAEFAPGEEREAHERDLLQLLQAAIQQYTHQMTAGTLVIQGTAE
jgi:phosphoglycerol transferase MdoB-like AlkP superfamily enzyme